MIVRVAYLEQSAARTPHPYTHHRRNSGQIEKFCPETGHVLLRFCSRYCAPYQRVAGRLGHMGRLGQKIAGYVRAGNLRGWGVCCLACRSRISALCAPRAPPCVFTSCFQWFVDLCVFGEFCPGELRSAPAAPLHHLLFHIL